MRSRHPILIVFGGLPGTGKTTLSRELTQRLAATYVRVDAIEQALRTAGYDVGPMGYVVANALAAENLRLGRVVVADSVNPVPASRDGWRRTALQMSARIAEIEVICSDAALHRQRAEARRSDITGLELPTWNDILCRHYEPWDRDHLVLDTANESIDRLLERAEAYLRDEIG
ncbi:AAA family ATPase [Bradyrhizobium manausense]|uniref:AAA family ATPase n=1 Tax=Bradyrhizobium manausense TaxID=989370 RepID=UPI001BA832A8|nr:AAA family ATPase [Bradyrhizobium manausense]MBR0836364.1 AAA family ATPase [Bradyrhizobium manausense]